MVSSKASEDIFIFESSNTGTVYMHMEFYRNWNISIEKIQVESESIHME